MKLMMAAELGSTAAFAILVFHKLLGGKGRNPFRLPSCPRVIPPQPLAWAKPRLASNRKLTASSRGRRDLRCTVVLLTLDSPTVSPITAKHITEPPRRPRVWNCPPRHTTTLPTSLCDVLWKETMEVRTYDFQQSSTS